MNAAAQQAPRLTLFREAALAAANGSEFGAPVSLMPTSWWGLTGFFTAVVVACMAFLATATFPRKESAAGILRYSLGEIRLTAPRAGVVTAILVREGQTVRVGDVLAYVATEQRFAAGDVVDVRLTAAIEREREMLVERLAALDKSEPLQAASLAERIAGIETQLANLTRELPHREHRLRLAEESLDAATILVRQQVYSAEQRRARHQELHAIEQSITELRGQTIDQQTQRADLGHRLINRIQMREAASLMRAR